MSIIYKWVQLSDIHFQNKTEGIQTDVLRKKLISYLENIHDCNSLILSGDYRFAPSKDEDPTQCAEYITQLAKCLGLQNQQIIAVPGNHDLSRSDLRTDIAQGCQKRYNRLAGIIDDPTQKHLKEDFTYYYNLCERIPGIQAIKKDGASHRLIQLNTCNILLLNTALTAFGDEDATKLIVGTNDIHQALETRDVKKPTLAVGHHSLSYMNLQEKDSLEKDFSDYGVRLYLCGHAHEPDVHEYNGNWEMIVGCVMQKDNDVMATFIEGAILDDGTVQINSHKWDPKERTWYFDIVRSTVIDKLYTGCVSDGLESKSKITEIKTDYPFSIVGHTLLSPLGHDGIKYYWEKDGKHVESITLNKRLRNSEIKKDNTTSAYTISTSIGCQLASMDKTCRFCETGTKPFQGILTAEEIALQCAFMVLFDINCLVHEKVRKHAREFAFMGQGEPGFSYLEIRQAIIMTDYIMEKLKQKVARYIISTCGIKSFIPMLIKDIRTGIFKNKVSVHFSLHEIEPIRQEIMPIDKLYSYKDFIQCCKLLYETTKEKIGVGIMMFDGYTFKGGNNKKYTLTPDRLKEILGCLDKEMFRIDLCAVNGTSAGKQSHEMTDASAQQLYQVVIDAGFEGKIFTSFGETKQSGCGMLSSTIDNSMEVAGNKTIHHFNTAVKLITEAKEYFYNSINM